MGGQARDAKATATLIRVPAANAVINMSARALAQLRGVNTNLNGHVAVVSLYGASVHANSGSHIVPRRHECRLAMPCVY